MAYARATGKTKALDIMRKYIDYIDTVFGPEEGKCHGYPGHPEIELALCSLYDLTGEEKYLRLAAYFINERGKEPNYFLEEQKKLNREFFPNGLYGLKYAQSHLPVRAQKSMEGHAVRALYLACGMADVALRTGDEALFSAQELFGNVTRRRMYVTGGVGSTYIGKPSPSTMICPGIGLMPRPAPAWRWSSSPPGCCGASCGVSMPTPWSGPCTTPACPV